MVFREEPGSEEICPVCWWQDDISSLIFAREACGPNKVSLCEAQENFRQIGVSESRLITNVDPHAPKRHKKDPHWRRIDLGVDSFPKLGTEPERLPDPGDICDLYYWRNPALSH